MHSNENLCRKIGRLGVEQVHRSTPVSGKTQQKLENKSMLLTVQTQHKSENPPLSTNTKNIG